MADAADLLKLCWQHNWTLEPDARKTGWNVSTPDGQYLAQHEPTPIKALHVAAKEWPAFVEEAHDG